MKAVLAIACDGPDVIRIAEVPAPSPKKNDMLNRIHASSVHAAGRGRGAQSVVAFSISGHRMNGGTATDIGTLLLRCGSRGMLVWHTYLLWRERWPATRGWVAARWHERARGTERSQGPLPL